jgi:hypothetical protein
MKTLVNAINYRFPFETMMKLLIFLRCMKLVKNPENKWEIAINPYHPLCWISFAFVLLLGFMWYSVGGYKLTIAELKKYTSKW